jgi:hypothetical protein
MPFQPCGVHSKFVPSVHPYVQNNLRTDGCILWSLILENLEKIAKQFQFLFRSGVFNDDFTTWWTTCFTVLNKQSGEKWNIFCVQYIFHISFTVLKTIQQEEYHGYHYELSYSTVKHGCQNSTVIKKKVLWTLDCIKIRYVLPKVPSSEI